MKECRAASPALRKASRIRGNVRKHLPERFHIGNADGTAEKLFQQIVLPQRGHSLSDIRRDCHKSLSQCLDHHLSGIFQDAFFNAFFNAFLKPFFPCDVENVNVVHFDFLPQFFQFLFFDDLVCHDESHRGKADVQFLGFHKLAFVGDHFQSQIAPLRPLLLSVQGHEYQLQKPVRVAVFRGVSDLFEGFPAVPAAQVYDCRLVNPGFRDNFPCFADRSRCDDDIRELLLFLLMRLGIQKMVARKAVQVAF